MDIEGKTIARYVLLPGIFPRAGALFGSGFGYLAFFMAQIFGAIDLLPKTHPYLLRANSGRYGVGHVVFEAQRHLKFDRHHIDKVFVFFMILAGLALLLMQIALLVISTLLAPVAHAGMAPLPPFAQFFITPVPTNDIAFVLLERSLGVPGIGGPPGFFNSCVSLNVACFSGYFNNTFAEGVFPWPFHVALHQMFQVYSIGLLLVGIVILMYYVITVVAETAQSGTPFGKRFNRVWAPIRLVVAIGLLIPTATGLNSAQYITLYLAKWGSSFATNGWIMYNDTVNLTAGVDTLVGPTSKLIPDLKSPEVTSLMEFFTVAATCRAAYMRLENPIDIKPYLVRGGDYPYGNGPGAASWEYTVNTGWFQPTGMWDTQYAQIMEFFNFGDWVISIGHRGLDPNGDPLYKTDTGYVAPLCGQITIPITMVTTTDLWGEIGGGDGYYDGVEILQAISLWLFDLFWTATGYCGAPLNAGPFGVGPYAAGADYFCKMGFAYAETYDGKEPPAAWGATTPVLPTPPDFEFVMGEMDNFYQNLNGIFPYVAKLQNDLNWTENLETTAGAGNDWATVYGWAGAGLWYNTLARMTGAHVAAWNAIPRVKKYPLIMEQVKKKRLEQDENVEPSDIYNPVHSNGEEVDFADKNSIHFARAMNKAREPWDAFYPKLKHDPIRDTIAALFGLEGLYDFANNRDNNVHPIIQMAAIGRALLESSYRYFALSGAAIAGGGLMNLLGQFQKGTVLDMASGISLKVALASMSIGVILFYLLPFMPFIYFFFAVGGWIKAVFEAMVGVPLWALAHLRIDGNGLPGDAAMNGYYLLLEIFIRPILIVFGLIAAVSVFAGMITVLHAVWIMVIANVGGFNEDPAVTGPNSIGTLAHLRSEIDTLIYSIIYTIIAYMIGMSCFKLIDLIPNYILRWMGTSVSTFGEGGGDPAENLAQNTMLGMRQAGSLAEGVHSKIGASTSQLGSALHK